MTKYTKSDFSIGDEVFHLSNDNLFMVVYDIEEFHIVCRWMDKSGKLHLHEFLPAELGKRGDLNLGGIF